MSTNTAVPTDKDFEAPVETTLDLPPLAVLRVGDKADFVLEEVSITKDDEDEDRYYFRGRLLSTLSCETKAKGEEAYSEVTFTVGDSISLPGSGSLNYQLARITNKRNGVALNEKKVGWTGIEGDRFIVERLKDDKMAKGRHKGKMVKAFKVLHAIPKK